MSVTDGICSVCHKWHEPHECGIIDDYAPKMFRCGKCGISYPQGTSHYCGVPMTPVENFLKQEQQRMTAQQELSAGVAIGMFTPRQETEALIDERAATHGSFQHNALHGQHLRDFFRGSIGWGAADERQREALDYIAGKLSRILSGQPGHRDHWEDIAGYATLACHPEKQR